MLSKKIEIEFTEPLLGTLAADPKLHERYIASLAPDAPSRAEEVAALGAEEVNERALTVFAYDDDGDPMLWDYQIKGFLKENAGILKKQTGSPLDAKTWRAHKKNIDNQVFLEQRRIKLVMPRGREVGMLERPLRASTPQGERVALAASEKVPDGTTMRFDLLMFDESLWPGIQAILDFGRFKGIGQWRNAGYGRFEWRQG